MAAVTVAAVAKKAVAALASNKKGRKFLGYTIGIAIFILCIPIIMVYCVFGWMAGSGEMNIQAAAAGALHGAINDTEYNETVDQIETLFKKKNLPDGDIYKAQMMSISYLAGMSEQENYYERLASCFTDTTEDKTVYMLLEETFDIDISDKDIERMDSLYGVTPARKTEQEVQDETADDQP